MKNEWVRQRGMKMKHYRYNGKHMFDAEAKELLKIVMKKLTFTSEDLKDIDYMRGEYFTDVSTIEGVFVGKSKEAKKLEELTERKVLTDRLAKQGGISK